MKGITYSNGQVHKRSSLISTPIPSWVNQIKRGDRGVVHRDINRVCQVLLFIFDGFNSLFVNVLVRTPLSYLLSTKPYGK